MKEKQEMMMIKSDSNGGETDVEQKRVEEKQSWKKT